MSISTVSIIPLYRCGYACILRIAIDVFSAGTSLWKKRKKNL